MRVFLWIFVLCLSIVALACDDGSDTPPQGTTENASDSPTTETKHTVSCTASRTPVAGTPAAVVTSSQSAVDAATYQEAVLSHVESRYQAAYSACVVGRREFEGSITWTKDAKRSRFDEADLAHGGDLAISYFVAPADTSRGRVYHLCSDDLTAYFETIVGDRPLDERLSGLEEVCIEDDLIFVETSILDRYGLKDALKFDVEEFKDVDPLTWAYVDEVTHRDIAGHPSTCFIRGRSWDTTTEECFGDAGVLTYARRESDQELAVLQIEGPTQTPQAVDFELPFPVVEIP